jgi:hypothetical protein
MLETEIKSAWAKKIVTPHLSGKKLDMAATLGNVKLEDCGQGQPGLNARPYLMNNQRKKGWRHGSSSTVPASLVQSPEFKEKKQNKNACW